VTGDNQSPGLNGILDWRGGSRGELASRSAFRPKLFRSKGLLLAKHLANCSPIGEKLGEQVGLWHKLFTRKHLRLASVRREAMQW
jgi:hypothetical protein